MQAANAVDGEVGVFEVAIDRLFVPSRPGTPLKVRATDPTGFVHLVWFGGSAQHIDRLLPRGETRLVSGKVERFNGEVQIVHPGHRHAGQGGRHPRLRARLSGDAGADVAPVAENWSRPPCPPRPISPNGRTRPG